MLILNYEERRRQQAWYLQTHNVRGVTKILSRLDKKNKYNQDMVSWKYTAPQETVLVLKKYAPNSKCKILDAGCGTGLVGIELKKCGYSNIDGVDFSQNMLDLIPQGIYKKIEKVDLNKLLKFKDNMYDVIMCVGTFTYGHVKPQSLDELIRITKNKGVI